MKAYFALQLASVDYSNRRVLWHGYDKIWTFINFFTWGTKKNTHCVFIPYAGFSQIQSHMGNTLGAITLIIRHESKVKLLNFLFCMLHIHIMASSTSRVLWITFYLVCNFSRDWHTEQKKKSQDPVPSLAVLHTEKQAFHCAALQSCELYLGIKLHA